MDTLTTKMKKYALTILFILLASPAWATTYHLAPASGGGNDSNNGTSASTPWLSPNHAVNCGDVIIAAASASYSAADFGSGKWGTVSCPAGNNVAWLQCATFDGCKISSSSSDIMTISASFWGAQGWEITTSGAIHNCFTVRGSGSSVHHVVLANNIAHDCGSGFFAGYSGGGGASVDYIVFVGNIAYNAATGSASCNSGFSIWEPQNHDTAAGTHIYVAGNFSIANLNPSPCAGGSPTDGEGIILDSFDGSQSGLSPYPQQAVAYNNMLLGNGGRGLEIYNNRAGSAHAPIYLEYNTMWGNNNATNQNWQGCGEIEISSSLDVTALHNLAMTSATNGCGANPIFAFSMAAVDGSVTVNDNLGYGPTSSAYTFQFNSSGFAYGPANVFGTNPGFSNPSTPGAPSCGSATNVTNCMAAVIANFTPTTAAAKAFGYQAPSTSPASDPLFPQWLCNVNLPQGLVTMGCASSPSSSSPAPPTNISATVR
jgi:hypothetical protein